jgi:2-iminobutanoate/2-iminopropanoate deaminase
MGNVDLGAIPFSAVTRAGGLLFVSGQVPLDMDSGLTVGSSLREQMSRVLLNLAAVLDAAGSSMSDVVKTTVYLTDITMLDEFNREYRRYFAEQYPARTLVEVSALARAEWLVEIEAVARSRT